MNRVLAFPSIWSFPANSRHWLFVALGLYFSSAASAQQFPYLAYVTAEQSYVRSGPGQRYYPTARVPEGFAVEVYRHDAEGWCAIRPPEGSFSWVPSHQVRTVEPGVVEVVGEHVVTRVGSSLSPNRSAVQVLLPLGERVQIFTSADADDPRWVRVAAPAGEFRWIAADALSLQPPLEAVPLPKSLPHVSPKSSQSRWSRQTEHSRGTTRGEPNAFDHLHPTTAATQTGLQFEPPTGTAVGNPLPYVETDPNAMDVVAGSPAELQLAQFQASSTGVQSSDLLAGGATSAMPTQAPSQASHPLPRVRFRGLTPASSPTVGTVEELELRLSQAVVEPPQQWKLEPIEAAANSLLAETKTLPVRAQLREVLERITRFQQVQQRYNDSPNVASSLVSEQDPFATSEGDEASLGELTSMSSGMSSGMSSSMSTSMSTGMSSGIRERAKRDLDDKSKPATGGRTLARDKPLYDAAGLLKPVVSKREEAPKYALVDEQGKVVSFVTPTPDLNLTPYIGRRIGVHGTRGFMPEYRRAHVTAGRVTPIEDTIRR